MSKSSLSSAMLLCAALAACSNSDASRTLTAPDAPARSEAPADLGVAYTPDGSFDFTSSSEELLAQLPGPQLAAAQLAASARAAGGSRSSGHVGFPTGVPAAGIASEKYSYVALSTDPVTFAAKGQYQVTLTAVTGNSNTIHGDVVCMNTFGNTTRVGGQITKLSRNGVEIPIPPTATHNIWVVVDNGEGNATPDQVSLIRFSNALTAQFYCANGFLSTVFPNGEGNIQVQP